MGASDFSFRAFSEQDFYRRVNEWLIDRVGLQRGWAVVDVGCGCGAVTELIAERIRGGRDAVVTGLDLSAAALKEAKERFTDARDVLVEFVQARAEEMSRALRRAADAVVFCNGIHYIEDKSQLLAEVHRTLPAGGVFAFNTTFFHGAHLPETDRFYRRWMLKTLRRLRERYDLKPEREKVESRQQWTAVEYQNLLSGARELRQQSVKSRAIGEPFHLGGHGDLRKIFVSQLLLAAPRRPEVHQSHVPRDGIDPGPDRPRRCIGLTSPVDLEKRVL